MVRGERRAKKPEWPWEAFDATSIIRLARAQFFDDLSLVEELAQCHFARRNNCCDDRVCGYHFFGDDHPDPARRDRAKFERTVMLTPDDRVMTGDIAIDRTADGRIGAIEFV
ncbi:MAG: hypothetical protein ABI577_12730 [bacterium]